MYAYEWDVETGGYLLVDKILKFSKEPRPVYYKELDILGFDKHWNYDKDDTYPIMWAESSTYIYRGKKVGKTKGGNLYNKPEIILLEEPEENKGKLKFIDTKEMVRRNRELLDALVNKSIKELYNVYATYKNKVDLFYVAFSGGKDSIVLLDIVTSTIPNNELRVVFGDTQMEFSDTYDVIDFVKKDCEKKEIPFHIAKSHLDVIDSWEKFGAPAQRLKWCCSVHKTSPQITLLRDILKKPNFTGMAFIGVRGDESASRSEYEYVTKGKKHKGQYNCYPIFHWNTAELFLYIFDKELILNKAYLKGNSRAGCLVCPMASLKNEYMKTVSYGKDVEKFINLIEENTDKGFETKEQLKEYMELGGWKARRSGDGLKEIKIKYKDEIKGNKLEIKVISPTTNWKKWIGTIGELQNDENPYKIKHKDNTYSFEINEIEGGYIVNLNTTTLKLNPTFGKLFKQTFKKAAYCESCKACEVDCKKGVLTFKNNELNISDKCTHCSECHKVPNGCYVYTSVKTTKGRDGEMSKEKINSYGNHGPKEEWLKEYFDMEEEFHENHSLGKNMMQGFKRFLKDAKLLSEDREKKFTKTAKYIKRIGRKTEVSQGIMLINLAHTPQVNWYIKNINPFEKYKIDEITNIIDETGATKSENNHIRLSLARILETDLGSKVGLGKVERKGRTITSITRHKWDNPNSLVVLYGLYKFAEECDGYYQFTLTRLLNTNIESKGVSPTQIFTIDKETMKPILYSLMQNYPELIHISFTHDLDNITLKTNKTSDDVLDLIMEEFEKGNL